MIPTHSTIATPIGTLLLEERDGKLSKVAYVRKSKPGSGHGFGKIGIQCVNQINEYFSRKRKAFSLPLHFSGTLLQERVWTELQKIQYGERITYSELARRVGYPRAIRAVASAVGKNPLGIIIPCHRIIPKSGNDRIGNYAWGKAKKKMLLELEAETLTGTHL